MADSWDAEYHGYEQGPIRPPSESFSLLIRVTRHCAWNRCSFCPAYKNTHFSVRPEAHVLRDIDRIKEYVDSLQEVASASGGHSPEAVHRLASNLDAAELPVFRAAFQWAYAGGMRSVFLQDADALSAGVEQIGAIVKHLRDRFPTIEDITSYARTNTLTALSSEELDTLYAAGLNRLHVGLESGSDAVLQRMHKGVTKAQHLEAGLKVKAAGFMLSEYVMPGLGGRSLSKEHAQETADAINRIIPDFVRIRTLAVPPSSQLFGEYIGGKFDKCSDLEIIQELLSFLQHLDHLPCTLKSDHILNLIGELEGPLDQEGKLRMVALLEEFLSLPVAEQTLFQVGRRLGLFSRIRDLDDRTQRPLAGKAVLRQGITPQNADDVLSGIMTQFI